MKKKKIAIVTLFGNFNFGNRLQNFAMQEFLIQQNYIVSSIYKTDIYNKTVKKTIKNFVRYVYALISKKGKRSLKFWKFTKRYIKMTCVNSNKEFELLNKDFDYFIVGSDQVWNPEFFDIPYEQFLLFTQSEKKIAISASFGIEKIPENKIKVVRDSLNTFNHFSVREEKAALIIKDLINKDANVVIDPTMMLEKEKWDNYLTKVSPKKKYILVYFLGDLTEEYKKFIENVSSINNLDVIDILDEKSGYYDSDPFDFITLISKSSLVVTDSFHGSVFSIIFHIPLVICDRKDGYMSMNSRIETLVNKFNLENRLFENLNTKNIFNNSYEKYDQVIDFEREKVISYLKQCMGDKND